MREILCKIHNQGWGPKPFKIMAKRLWANHARNAEISEEEIVQTMLITSLISGVAPLQVAYARLKEQCVERR